VRGVVLTQNVRCLKIPIVNYGRSISNVGDSMNGQDRRLC
jgi:hypothetical protein